MDADTVLGVSWGAGGCHGEKNHGGCRGGERLRGHGVRQAPHLGVIQTGQGSDAVGSASSLPIVSEREDPPPADDNDHSG